MWQNLVFSSTKQYQNYMFYGLDLCKFEIQMRHLFACLGALFPSALPSPSLELLWADAVPDAAANPTGGCFSPVLVLHLMILAWHDPWSCLLLSCLWLLGFSCSGGFCWFSFCLNFLMCPGSILQTRSVPSCGAPLLPDPSIWNVECTADSWEVQQALCKSDLCFSNLAWFAGTGERGDAGATRQIQTKSCHRPWNVLISCCC